MVRKSLKKTTKHPKITEFLNRYNIPIDYFSATRKMIVRGVVLGVFIAFIPMPMQMAATLLFTPFFRFNVPIAVAMCWITNPVTMPPMYYIEYMAGSFLLGIEPEPVKMTLEWFSDNLSKIFIPLYTGAFTFSIVGSIGSYFLVNWLWKKSVKTERKKGRFER